MSRAHPAAARRPPPGGLTRNNGEDPPRRPGRGAPMRTLVAAATSFVIAATLVPSAAAQVPTQDSVSGSGATGIGRQFVEFTFDAHSGPSGENPTGTVGFVTFFGDLGRLDVACLSVSGSRASMILLAPPSAIAGLVVSVEDNGPGQDRIAWRAETTLPGDCPVPSGVFGTETTSGDISVTDAKALPTSKGACKNGGWRTFGVFENQGDCVSYVATRGGNAPAAVGT
jgi:hypothetical protein